MTSHRFSVAEYYHMGELGILDQRTELIEGQINDMEPIGPWHASVLQKLTLTFAEPARGRFAVRVQLPIDLGPECQPQPDLVLCRPESYWDQHPGAGDIHLIVEVADTSLSFDLGQKRALYSAAGIPEYWVVDVKTQTLTRFLLAGTELVETPVSGSNISPAAFPAVNIDLTQLFG